VAGSDTEPKGVFNAPQVVQSSPEAAIRSLWGHRCTGIPLPDDNPAESYRPPIDQLTEDFFHGGMLMAQGRRSGTGSGDQAELSSSGSGVPQGVPGRHRGGAWSVSTGASLCSSASSAGSTSTGSRGRRGLPTPKSVGSPLNAGGEHRRGGQQQQQGSLMQEKSKISPVSRHQITGSTTATPGSSSPHGSSASTVVPIAAGASSSREGGTPVATHTPQGGAGHAAPGASTHGRAVGSRDGSRGSSPWHLPSPMSELSTASDRVNSSQPSGSDSCGENHMMPVDGGAGPCSFNELCASEDPRDSHSGDSHWPRSTQPSDSDCTTPRSHDLGPNSAQEERDRGGTKDPQHALWENIKCEMARVELSRDRMPRRLDITQSPGSAGGMGNFREAVGMNESGPVIPFGHGARRDANAAAASLPGSFNPMPRASGVNEGNSQHGFTIGTGDTPQSSRSRRHRGNKQHGKP